MNKQESQKVYDHRREVVFLFTAGLFISCMTMLNIIGITRFVNIIGLEVAVGVFSYPLTFLCTDFISEIYGRKRANLFVWVGLFVNAIVLLFMYLGHILPSVEEASQPSWQTLFLAHPVLLPTGSSVSGSVQLFDLVYACTVGSIAASMLAYLFAQFFDVYIFHAIKKRFNGRMLWLRNNVSTMVSQLIDSIIIISFTFGILLYSGAMTLKVVLIIFFSTYAFKFIAALVDTIPFILLVKHLGRYLGHGPSIEGSNAKGYIYADEEL